MGNGRRPRQSAVELAPSRRRWARSWKPGLRPIQEAVDAITAGRARPALPQSAREASGSIEVEARRLLRAGRDDASAPACGRMEELLPGRPGALNARRRIQHLVTTICPRRSSGSFWKTRRFRGKPYPDRIRHPGGLHEWYMVKHTPGVQKTGLSMNDINGASDQGSRI